MPEATRERLSPKEFVSLRTEEIAWRQFPAFPPGGELAVLVGDISKPGPYVVRVRIPDGVKLMPHRHPEDRIYTVIRVSSTSAMASNSTRRRS